MAPARALSFTLGLLDAYFPTSATPRARWSGLGHLQATWAWFLRSLRTGAVADNAPPSAVQYYQPLQRQPSWPLPSQPPPPIDGAVEALSPASVTDLFNPSADAASAVHPSVLYSGTKAASAEADAARLLRASTVGLAVTAPEASPTVAFPPPPLHPPAVLPLDHLLWSLPHVVSHVEHRSPLPANLVSVRWEDRTATATVAVAVGADTAPPVVTVTLAIPSPAPSPSLSTAPGTGYINATATNVTRRSVLGHVLRGLATAKANPREIRKQLLECKSVQEVQDVVNRHGSSMRPEILALVVHRMGQLRPAPAAAPAGAAAGAASPIRTSQRPNDLVSNPSTASRRDGTEGDAVNDAAGWGPNYYHDEWRRRQGGWPGDLEAYDTAARCTFAALDGRVDMVGLMMLLEGWRMLRRPPTDCLARLLDELVPGASAALNLQQRRQRHQPPRDGSPADPAPSPYGSTKSRRQYGRLHMATLPQITALVPLLGALGGLTPAVREVMVTIAVRRAVYEEPNDLAAAAAAFCKPGLNDARVASALLNAVLARRTATADQVAAAMRLCSKAGYYEPTAFAAAAEALVTTGVGGLDKRNVTAVVRAFSAGRHIQPMLTGALAAHAKRLLQDGLYDWADAGAADGVVDADVGGSGGGGGGTKLFHGEDLRAFANAVDGDSTGGDGGGGSSSGGSGGSSSGGGAARVRLLHAALNSVGVLAQGFGSLKVYDQELYGRLAEAAVQLFREAAALVVAPRTPAGDGARPNPRVLSATVVALAEGFAAVGWGEPGVMQVVQAWTPTLAPHMKASEVSSLAASLAELRFRQPRVLAALDSRSARLLTFALRDIAPSSNTPASVFLPPPPSSGHSSSHGGNAAPEILSHLPYFLEAVCWGLAYECRATLDCLLATSIPAFTWRQGSRRIPAAAPLPAVLAEIMAATEDEASTPAHAAARSATARRQVCRLMGALSCADALRSEVVVRALMQTLVQALVPAPAPPPPPPSAALPAGPAADGSEAAGGPSTPSSPLPSPPQLRAWMPSERNHQPLLSPAGAVATAAALDEADVCHLSRAFIAINDAGLAAVLQEELPPPLAAPLLARVADVWHAAGLGTAAPLYCEDQRAQRLTVAGHRGGWGAQLAEAPPPPPPLPWRRRRGGDAAPSGLLSQVLPALQLPVFGACVTTDGHFRVERGVAVGGVVVGVEVLPDEAFAADGCEQYVLVGDAAFRKRCLRERGWRLVAFRASEWAAAAAVGSGACLELLSRRARELDEHAVPISRDSMGRREWE